MMQNIFRWHEYDNLMWDITICDGKNMDIADWLLQIEKVAVLTNIQEYELATAESTSNSYTMLKWIRHYLSSQEIKKKWEVYYSVVKEVHTASDLHRKQWPDKTSQEYTPNFTDFTEKAMVADPANFTNRVIIFLFIKNLYNHGIQNWKWMQK